MPEDAAPATETFGMRLQLARDQRVWSQQQLADASGIWKTTISRLENDQNSPTPSTITKLAEALGVSALWLRDGTTTRQRGLADRIPRPRKRRDTSEDKG